MINIVGISGWSDTFQELLDADRAYLNNTLVLVLDGDYYVRWSSETSEWTIVVDTPKQDALVSGENIKTINGNSLLGSGNLNISGGGGGTGNAYFPQGWG